MTATANIHELISSFRALLHSGSNSHVTTSEDRGHAEEAVKAHVE
jgi:hypothetical protein